MKSVGFRKLQWLSSCLESPPWHVDATLGQTTPFRQYSSVSSIVTSDKNVSWGPDFSLYHALLLSSARAKDPEIGP